MPHTINGVGTSYWGKENLHIRRGSCSECGAMTDLSDYDTTRYFVVLFAPLVPLGKMRIFDDCKNCRKHRAMKLGQWKALCTSELETSQALFDQQPQDSQAACKLLEAGLAYGDEESFLQRSKQVMQHHGGQPEVLATLGAGLEHLGHRSEAKKVFARRLQVSDTPEARQDLVWALLHDGETEEARALLQGVHASKDEKLLPSLYLLVEALQAKGDHEGALRELEAIKETWPEEAEDPATQAYQTLSLKHQKSGKRVVSALLQPPAAVPSGTDRGGAFARFLWPVLVTLILVPLIGIVIKAASGYEVFLVNGWEKPYTVQIGDETLDLPNLGPIKYRLPRSKPLTIAPGPGAPDFESTEISIDLSFFQSLRKSKVVVVNPDRLAVFLQESVQYASDEAQFGEEEEAPYSLRAGQPLYTFADIDYPFEEFPDEVETSKKSGTVWKTGLTTVDYPSALVWAILWQTDNQDEALSWLQARMKLGTSNESDDPYLLAEAVDAETFRSIAQERLAQRPISVAWHRAYQLTLEQEGSQKEVEAEYRRILTEDPDDSNHMYLLARVLASGQEARDLTRLSVQGSEPGPWPLYGAAFQEMTEGNFSPALESIQKALVLAPEEYLFQQTETELLQGLERYEELALRSQEERGEELDPYAANQEILWFAAAGKMDRATSILQEALASLQEEGASSEEIEEWRLALEGARALGNGNLSEYLSTLEGADDPATPLYSALLQGDAEAVLQVTQEPDSALTGEQLLLAHVCLLKSASSQSPDLLSQAIEALGATDSEERHAVDLLSEKEPVKNPQDLILLRLPTQLKSLTLAVLAHRGGPGSRTLNDLAYRLASGPGFEAQMLRKLLRPGAP